MLALRESRALAVAVECAFPIELVGVFHISECVVTKRWEGGGWSWRKDGQERFKV